MADVKVGDVVQLKSGGPKMTVNSTTAGSQFHCVWFNGRERKEGSFDEEALTVVKAGE